ncbi:hypothetical protein FQN54_004053 [Arachnomyces sp. PD_36]|nr:hypothetical protein FQN54_004053 [Arachnomyces sp. PD_36]
MAASDAIRADCVLHLKTSSSDLSQSTFADMVDVDTTPPTSSSGLSSHDVVPHIGEPHARSKSLGGGVPANLYAQTGQQSQLTSVGGYNGLVAKTRPSSLPKTGPENVVVQGQKRTASGEIKLQNNAVHSRIPSNGGFKGHSRTMSTMSTASNSNRIAELSSQLRARLSYAASIVEKNWQSRDINGKEGASSRYSQSPARSRSSSHDLNHIYLSPRNEATRSQMHYLNGSPEKIPTYASDLTSPRKPRQLNGPPHISSSTSADIVSLTRSAIQPEHNNTFPGEIPNLNKNQRRTLAPPADIVTGENRARRRPNPNISPVRQQQNAPQGRYQHTSHNRTTSTNSIIPGTPPQTYTSQPLSNPQYLTPASASTTTVQGRTPSQNAIMEQDAIETLLFMSSPGNSGYHPSNNSSQNSQQHQHLQKQDQSLNHAISSSMAPPRSNHEPATTQVGLGIAGLDPQKTPTQHQRPARRVSFLDNTTTYSDNLSGTTSNSDLDFHPNSSMNMNMGMGMGMGLSSGFRFEDQAGDEIDRLLDQMVEEESDSDDNFIRSTQAWIQGGREGREEFG